MPGTSQLKQDLIERMLDEMERDGSDTRDRDRLRRALGGAVMVPPPIQVGPSESNGRLARVTWFEGRPTGVCSNVDGTSVQVVKLSLIDEIAVQLGFDSVVDEATSGMMMRELERRGWQVECHWETPGGRVLFVGIPPGCRNEGEGRSPS